MVNIEDIYDIIKKPEATNYKLLFLGLALCLILISLAFFVYYKYLKNKKLSPEDLAIKNLKSLDVEKYFEEKKSGSFYEKVSEILKIYFSSKTGNNCQSMSDTEFCDYLKNNKNLDTEKMELLVKLISNFQEVKFARLEAIKQNMFDDISKIISIISIVKID